MPSFICSQKIIQSSAYSCWIWKTDKGKEWLEEDKNLDMWHDRLIAKAKEDPHDSMDWGGMARALLRQDVC